MMADETTSEKATAEKKNPVLPKGAAKPPGDIRRRVEKTRREGPFIKYVGHAAQRLITPTDWGTLPGVEMVDPKAVHVWNTANDKMIEADRFSDTQLDYLLVDDVQKRTNVHNFVALDWDKDGNLAQTEI